MFKKLFLLTIASFICLSNISAQLNKAEIKFINTPFKIQMNGDALSGVRADGKANTYGLPSIKDFMNKYRSEDKSMPLSTFTFVNIGATTIYDICSNASPVEVWQDPVTPENIHAVFVTNPAGDPGFINRRSKYYFSTDKGTTWWFIADVPNLRSGFPTISGFSDGSALISNHSADGGGTTRAQAYKDLFPGLGAFTRFDAPGNNGYIWPRVITTNNIILTNKFLMMASINGQDSTRYNICTNVSSTPGTWLGWTSVPSDVAETFALGRGTDGRIGIAFKNNDTPLPASYADVWFIESTNNGTTFSTPLKIFDANFGAGGDSLGMLRGISIAYRGNTPAVVFETIKQTQEGSFFPASPAKIRFWTTTLTGVDPNRSIVIADTTNVGFHPYIGVNDVMASLCRPNIGVSSDGTVLFAAFSVPSNNVGGTSDTTSFMDIWFTYSANGGNTWQAPQKVNPVSPIKDWRYVSISPVNDKVGSNYYCNMTALRGHVPGSFINGPGNGESLEEYWSIRALVNVGPVPPNPPTLISPANNTTSVSVTPLIDWSDVSGALTYNIQVSTNSGFTTTIINLMGINVSQYQVAAGVFQPNTLYYWRVSSTNINGTGNWSSVWSFTTLGGPTAPALLSPANGSNLLTFTPTLDWNDVPTAISYEVQAATDTNFINLVINTGTAVSQYIVLSGLLAGNTTYYWRARGENGTGTGPWSARWNFRVITLPTAPNLVSPLNYSTNQPPNVLLDWDSLASAASYRIQLSTDSLFNSLTYDTAGVIRSYVQMRPGILSLNTKYYWRVNATNISGTGSWSGIWNFRVNPTGVYQYSSEIPKEYKLHNNYPNPFNPTTKIRFDIPKISNVKISVYDISGRMINQLINSQVKAGQYEILWNANNLSSGVYFYRIETEGYTDVKRMLLVK